MADNVEVLQTISVYQQDCTATYPIGPKCLIFTVFFPPYWRYNPLWVCILQPASGALASSRTRFLDTTTRHSR